MAAPVYKSSVAPSGYLATGTSVTVYAYSILPPVLTDLVILQVLQDGTGAAPALGTVNGLEDLAGTDGALTFIGSFALGTAGTQHLWCGRPTQDTVIINSNAVVTTAADDLYCRFYAFSGASAGTTLADVFENGSAGNFVNGSGSTAQVDDTGVTTLGSDRLAVNLVAINDDNAMGPFTGMTGGTWAEPIAEYAQSTGNDGCIQIQTATMASSGTINGGSYAMALADGWGVVGFAIKPVDSNAKEVTLAIKGGGVFTPSVQGAHNATATATASGRSTVSQGTNRNVTSTATGSGVFTLTYEVASGPAENHDSDATANATGGGAFSAVWQGAHNAVVTTTAGGTVTVTGEKGAAVVLSITGGGRYTNVYAINEMPEAVEPNIGGAAPKRKRKTEHDDYTLAEDDEAVLLMLVMA